MNFIPTPGTSNSDSKDFQCSLPEIVEEARYASLDQLPKKSRGVYESAYNSFIEWQEKNHTSSFSEDTMLLYFEELRKKYKSSSLWTHYSMLKSTININHNINIEPYNRLRTLLKRESEGYHPKRSEVFTGEDINRFISEAPDYEYLVTKVALIMGVMGACGPMEMHEMEIDHIRFFGGCIQVHVPNRKTRTFRYFTITDEFYDIVKKYADLRPRNTTSKAFFMNYHKGKCKNQVIGINKFGSMGKDIAKFLGLENPESYTGHSMRKSSALLCAEGGSPMVALKRHGGWESATFPEGYIAKAKRIKIEASDNFIEIDCDESIEPVDHYMGSDFHKMLDAAENYPEADCDDKMEPAHNFLETEYGEKTDTPDNSIERDGEEKTDSADNDNETDRDKNGESAGSYNKEDCNKKDDTDDNTDNDRSTSPSIHSTTNIMNKKDLTIAAFSSLNLTNCQNITIILNSKPSKPTK